MSSEYKYDQWEVFEMIRAAYERGYNWCHENPDSRPFLNKAAYDYADKTLGSRDTLPPPPEAGTVNEGEK